MNTMGEMFAHHELNTLSAVTVQRRNNRCDVITPLTVESEVSTKNIYEVLQQKELDIRRVLMEIEALHFVIPLIADEADWLEQGVVVASSFSTTSPGGRNVSKTAA